MSASNTQDIESESVNNGDRLYLIVFNPTRNRLRKRRLNALVEALKRQGATWHLFATEQHLQANKVALAKRLSGVTDVIVVGGDGTFNAVINCLPFAERDGSVPFNVGLVPAGTGNDFARGWYGKSLSDKEMINIVLGDNTQRLPIAECDMGEQRRLFHNVMGAGFDARIAKALEQNKSLFKSFSYVWAGIKYIPFYQEPSCIYKSPSQHRSFDNFITAFANSPYFGGGLPIAPAAKPTETQLDVVSVGKLPTLKKFHLLVLLLTGRHRSDPNVFQETLASDQSATIETKGLELEADGEFIGYSPCTVRHSGNWIHLKAAVGKEKE